MYQSIVPHIPKDIWEQPVVNTARAYIRYGNIIDVHHMKFIPDTLPLVELLRDSKSGTGVLDIRAPGIPTPRLRSIYDTNGQDSEIFYNDAVLESVKQRSYGIKTVLSGAFSISAGLSAVSQYVNYRNANDCIGRREQLMTIEACQSVQFQDHKIQSRNESIAFGTGFVILGALSVLAFKMRMKHLSLAQQEFTKAALAICNARACEQYLSQEAGNAPQPE